MTVNITHLLWSYSSKYGQALLQFISSIIVARNLTPEEIGIFSVSLAIIGFAHLIRDFGIGDYIVQEKNLTQQKIRTAYTLSLISSWAIAFSLFLSSNFISKFFLIPDLSIIIKILAVNFLAIPFSSTIFSLLRRELKFKERLKIEITSAVIVFVCTIYLVYKDYGTFSLVYASLLGTLTSVILCQRYKPFDFSFFPTLKSLKQILSYSSFSSGSNISAYVSKASPDIIIGRLLDMTSVGLFNRGLSLLNMIEKVIIDGIKPILMPYFSILERGQENTVSAYIKILNLGCIILLPIYAFLIIDAKYIIPFLFGNQWGESIPLLQILTFAAVFSTLSLFSSELFKSTGLVKHTLAIEVLTGVATILALLYGLQFGLKQALTYMVLVPLLKAVITHTIIYKKFDYQLLDILVVLGKGIISFSLYMLSLTVVNQQVEVSSTLVRLLIDSFLLFTIFSILAYFFQREPIKEIYKFILKK